MGFGGGKNAKERKWREAAQIRENGSAAVTGTVIPNEKKSSSSSFSALKLYMNVYYLHMDISMHAFVKKTKKQQQKKQIFPVCFFCHIRRDGCRLCSLMIYVSNVWLRSR